MPILLANVWEFVDTTTDSRIVGLTVAASSSSVPAERETEANKAEVQPQRQATESDAEALTNDGLKEGPQPHAPKEAPPSDKRPSPQRHRQTTLSLSTSASDDSHRPLMVAPSGSTWLIEFVDSEGDGECISDSGEMTSWILLASLGALGAVRQDIRDSYKLGEKPLGSGANAEVFQGSFTESGESLCPVVDHESLARAAESMSRTFSKASKSSFNEELNGFPQERMPVRQVKKMAIKVLNPVAGQNADNSVLPETIKREVALVAASQGHPNIVQLYGLFRMPCKPMKKEDKKDSQGQQEQQEQEEPAKVLCWSIAMELCPGGDLFDAVVQKCFEEERAKFIVAGLLGALVHIHARGIVHRDVKVENVLLRKDGQPVLADFGIACRDTDSVEMARRCGSPGYAAPEILCGTAYTTKVDVFSMGVVLHFMLSSKTPFQGSNVASTIRRTVRQEVDFSHRRFACVSESCKEFALAMLQKNPKSRPTAEVALAMLTSGQDAKSREARPPDAPKPDGMVERPRAHSETVTVSKQDDVRSPTKSKEKPLLSHGDKSRVSPESLTIAPRKASKESASLPVSPVAASSSGGMMRRHQSVKEQPVCKQEAPLMTHMSTDDPGHSKNRVRLGSTSSSMAISVDRKCNSLDDNGLPVEQTQSPDSSRTAEGTESSRMSLRDLRSSFGTTFRRLVRGPLTKTGSRQSITSIDSGADGRESRPPQRNEPHQFTSQKTGEHKHKMRFRRVQASGPAGDDTKADAREEEEDKNLDYPFRDASDPETHSWKSWGSFSSMGSSPSSFNGLRMSGSSMMGHRDSDTSSMMGHRSTGRGDSFTHSYKSSYARLTEVINRTGSGKNAKEERSGRGSDITREPSASDCKDDEIGHERLTFGSTAS